MEVLSHVLSALVGFVGGITPKIIEWWKTRKEEDRKDKAESRKDHRISIIDQQQLLKDVRNEREEIRFEIRELRSAHEDCLTKAAKQEEKIGGLVENVTKANLHISEQKEEIKILRAKLWEMEKTSMTLNSRVGNLEEHSVVIDPNKPKQ